MFLLTSDDQMSAGANRLDSQISPDLTLVFAVVGQRGVGDPQVVNTGVLIADHLQSRMAYDAAVCNINRDHLRQTLIRNDRLVELVGPGQLTFFAPPLNSIVIYERIRN